MFRYCSAPLFLYSSRELCQLIIDDFDMQNACTLMIQTKVAQLQEVANMQQQFSKRNVGAVTATT